MTARPPAPAALPPPHRVPPFPSGPAHGSRFSSLTVLGDSLSDSGNAGRFCDGPVWVELLGEQLRLPLVPASRGGTNHAVGGARIRGGANEFGTQLNRLLAQAGGELDPAALHVVYAGGNDLLAAMTGLLNPRGAEEIVAALDGLIRRMVDAGAYSFLLPNLPNLGLTPAVAAFGAPAARMAQRATLAFNAALAQAQARWDESGLADIIAIDVYTEVQRMVGAGAAARLLFHDAMHPAASVHRHIAMIAAQAIEGATAAREPEARGLA